MSTRVRLPRTVLEDAYGVHVGLRTTGAAQTTRPTYWRDVRHLVSDLTYTTVLPGGYGACQFVLAVPPREAIRYIRPLSRVRITFAGDVVWEGYAELPQAIDQATAVRVSAIGPSRELAGHRFTALYGEQNYGRFFVAGQRDASYSQSTAAQFGAPVLAGADGAAAQLTYPQGQAIVATDDQQFILEIPPGVAFRRFKCSWRTISDANLTWTVLAADSLPSAGPGSGSWAETVKAAALFSASTAGTIDYTFSGTGRRYLMFKVDVAAGATPASDTYLRIYNARWTTEVDPTGAALDPDALTTSSIVASAVAAYGQGVEFQAAAQYPGTSLATLAFDQLVTVEDVLSAIRNLTGWEWAVYDDDRLYLGPDEQVAAAFAQAYNAAAAGTPPWWLEARRSDGHLVNVTADSTECINRVTVDYALATGERKQLTVDSFNDPGNPLNGAGGVGPLRIVKGTVSIPNTTTDAQAALVAAAALAQKARPVLKGTISWATPRLLVRATGTSAPYGPAIPAEGIKAGMWVNMPDADELVYGLTTSLTASSNPRPPTLAVIRSTSVSAANGTVTCEVDSGSDRLSVLLARLQAGMAT